MTKRKGKEGVLEADSEMAWTEMRDEASDDR